MNDPLRCKRCDQVLDPDKAVWLDLNLHTHVWRAEPWPDEVSQGAFPFGAACAEKVEGREFGPGERRRRR